MTMQTTRRGFLRGLAGLGAALALPKTALALPGAAPLVVPAAPALAVPERRLWALDRTMVAARTDPPGPPLTMAGLGGLYIEGELCGEILEWEWTPGEVTPMTGQWLRQYEVVQ
jgi:hypothetical protein